jgi:ABC-type polysaccharide/polyol phosphate export permease
MLIFIVAISVVYSRLLHSTIEILLPYLAAGMVAWIYVSTVLIESTETFVNAKSFIENVKLPYLTQVFRLIWRNLIVFFHNLIVFITIALILKSGLSWHTLLFIPGLLLLSIMLVSICLSIALVGTRFRDLPPVISSTIMVIFFVSPVTWQPSMIGENSLIIKLNPVVYFLDLIRSPLLGHAPMVTSWIVCGLLASVSFIISFGLFVRCRRRIAFWI